MHCNGRCLGGGWLIYGNNVIEEMSCCIVLCQWAQKTTWSALSVCGCMNFPPATVNRCASAKTALSLSTILLSTTASNCTVPVQLQICPSWEISSACWPHQPWFHLPSTQPQRTGHALLYTNRTSSVVSHRSVSHVKGTKLHVVWLVQFVVDADAKIYVWVHNIFILSQYGEWDWDLPALHHQFIGFLHYSTMLSITCLYSSSLS